MGEENPALVYFMNNDAALPNSEYIDKKWPL